MRTKFEELTGEYVLHCSARQVPPDSPRWPPTMSADEVPGVSPGVERSPGWRPLQRGVRRHSEKVAQGEIVRVAVAVLQVAPWEGPAEAFLELRPREPIP
jgi:hypothetical protein